MDKKGTQVKKVKTDEYGRTKTDRQIAENLAKRAQREVQAGEEEKAQKTIQRLKKMGYDFTPYEKDFALKLREAEARRKTELAKKFPSAFDEETTKAPYIPQFSKEARKYDIGKQPLALTGALAFVQEYPITKKEMTAKEKREAKSRIDVYEKKSEPSTTSKVFSKVFPRAKEESRERYKKLEKKYGDKDIFIPYSERRGSEFLKPSAKLTRAERQQLDKIRAISKGKSFEEYYSGSLYGTSEIAKRAPLFLGGAVYGTASRTIKSISPFLKTTLTTAEGSFLAYFGLKKTQEIASQPTQTKKGRLIAETALDLTAFGAGARVGEFTARTTTAPTIKAKIRSARLSKKLKGQLATKENIPPSIRDTGVSTEIRARPITSIRQEARLTSGKRGSSYQEILKISKGKPETISPKDIPKSNILKIYGKETKQFSIGRRADIKTKAKRAVLDPKELTRQTATTGQRTGKFKKYVYADRFLGNIREGTKIKIFNSGAQITTGKTKPSFFVAKTTGFSTRGTRIKAEGRLAREGTIEYLELSTKTPKGKAQPYYKKIYGPEKPTPRKPKYEYIKLTGEEKISLPGKEIKEYPVKFFKSDVPAGTGKKVRIIESVKLSKEAFRKDFGTDKPFVFTLKGASVAVKYPSSRETEISTFQPSGVEPKKQEVRGVFGGLAVRKKGSKPFEIRTTKDRDLDKGETGSPSDTTQKLVLVQKQKTEQKPKQKTKQKTEQVLKTEQKPKQAQKVVTLYEQTQFQDVASAQKARQGQRQKQTYQNIQEARQVYDTSLKQKSKFAQRTIQKQKQKSKFAQKATTLSKQSQMQLQKQKTIQKQKQILKTDTIQTQMQLQNLGQLQDLTQIQETGQIQDKEIIKKSKNKLRFDKKDVPIRDSIIKRRKPTSKTNFKGIRFKKSTDKLGVYVKRKGKDIKVASASSLQQAKKILRKRLSGTARASGFIKKKKKKLKVDLGKGYRKGKKDPYRVVEKRSRRIKSAGELRDITFKGISSKKRKWGGFKNEFF